MSSRIELFKGLILDFSFKNPKFYLITFLENAVFYLGPDAFVDARSYNQIRSVDSRTIEEYFEGQGRNEFGMKVSTQGWEAWPHAHLNEKLKSINIC